LGGSRGAHGLIDGERICSERTLLARIVPGGCPNGCGLNDLEVAIWPSVSAAENYFNEYKDVHDQGPFERVKNATISWNFNPFHTEHEAVLAALH
jgi:hypothetical protein